MWHGLEGIGWGWMAFGAVHMLLFWAVAIVAIIAIVRWLAGGAASADASRAIDILKGRYAKGEITREEFERMKRDLGEDERRG